MNHDEFDGEVCIANIGGRQRGTRLGFGVIMGVAAIAVTAVLLATGAPKPARLFVAPLYWLSAVGILQYRGRT
ncbi:MAG TPA: hypothetical protein VJ925_04530 [Longimicrobiales bacterium]|nr:hypothetical protein [Longimicrobiales bacterium]